MPAVESQGVLVERAIRADAGGEVHCWLTANAAGVPGPQPEPEPALVLPTAEEGASGASAGSTAPHLTIVASRMADGSSLHVYSLSRFGASVEIQLPARFDEVGLGAQVWPSALGLSIWLANAAEYGELTLAGTRMLELGAGVALPGLMTAQLGAEAPETAVLTDFSPPLVERIRANAARNATNGTKPPEAALLNWDEVEDCDAHDVLIGADLVYNRAHVNQLVQTVLPRLVTELSTLVLIQPGNYISSEDPDGARIFDTRNGWTELKAALALEGSVEIQSLRLSALSVDASAGASAEPALAVDLELLVFHKHARAKPAAPSRAHRPPPRAILSEDELSTMSVKQLKMHIASAGLSSADCVEKSDLIARAKEGTPA